MRDALKSYLALAGGVSELTRQRAVAAAKALVTQGEATAEQVGALAEDLLAQTKQNREAVIALVTYEVDRTLARVGLAQADEVEQLTQRVRALEAQLRGAGLTPGTTAPLTPGTTGPTTPHTDVDAKKAPPKQAPAQKAPGQKTAANVPESGSAAAAPPKKKAPAKAAAHPPKKAPKKAPAGGPKKAPTKAAGGAETATKAAGKRPARAAGPPTDSAGATTPDA